MRLQVGDGSAAEPVLAALPRYGLMDDVDAAIRAGAVALDATQYEYLFALMATPPRPMPGAGDPEPRPAAVATATPPAPAGGAQPSDADVAARVATVKEVLPDCGNGFVEACLQSLAWDTEATVNALLTGDLPPDVAGMDRAAATNPLRKPIAAVAAGSAATAADGTLSWGQAAAPAPAGGAMKLMLQRQQPEGAKTKSSKYAGALRSSHAVRASCARVRALRAAICVSLLVTEEV